MKKYAILINKEDEKPTKVELSFNEEAVPNVMTVKTQIKYIPELSIYFGVVNLEKKYNLKFHFEHGLDLIALYEEIDE